MSLHLPQPDANAAAVSARLRARIRDEIAASGGWIGFDRYMQLALYEPGLGYYSAGSVKLGASGDFVTAPEITPLFGQTLALQVGRWLDRLDAPVILEIGAGSGRLAESVIAALPARARRAEYWILEPSADLRERQRRRLADTAANVSWLDAPPAAAFEGVVLGNEVVDALPVARFVKRAGETRALGVGWGASGFTWAERAADAALAAAVARIERSLDEPLPDGYVSELNLLLADWFAGLTRSLTRGVICLSDYGLVRREYYHPSRSRGTLVCHYRHRVHADPFLFPGLQDLSAWVDFSACADAAAGFNVSGFTTQGQFLLASGAHERLRDLTGRERLEQGRAFKMLVMPGEMGERFKLLQLSRGIAAEALPGRDFRDRL
jgi:SAM-dependent MidA family methyltransferase